MRQGRVVRQGEEGDRERSETGRGVRQGELDRERSETGRGVRQGEE